MSRIICQFSCGAASAVATKLVLDQPGEVEIINAFIVEEPDDNRRFLADCERWFRRSISVLINSKDAGSIMEVFRRERYLVGPHGAP